MNKIIKAKKTLSNLTDDTKKHLKVYDDNLEPSIYFSESFLESEDPKTLVVMFNFYMEKYQWSVVSPWLLSGGLQDVVTIKEFEGMLHDRLDVLSKTLSLLLSFHKKNRLNFKRFQRWDYTAQYFNFMKECPKDYQTILKLCYFANNHKMEHLPISKKITLPEIRQYLYNLSDAEIVQTLNLRSTFNALKPLEYAIVDRDTSFNLALGVNVLSEYSVEDIPKVLKHKIFADNSIFQWYDTMTDEQRNHPDIKKILISEFKLHKSHTFSHAHIHYFAEHISMNNLMRMVEMLYNVERKKDAFHYLKKNGYDIESVITLYESGMLQVKTLHAALCRLFAQSKKQQDQEIEIHI